jgi:hypothetical protein
MTPLTDGELYFLSRVGLSPDDVHDGRGQSKKYRERAAKEAGKVLVLGPECQAAGHRLRTRSGHCAQCDTRKIAFQERYNAGGYVYIAGSLSGRAIKIGTAQDIPQRERQLRAERHAGYDDWYVLFSIWVNEAGRIENAASSRVISPRVFGTYFKDNIGQTATEVFKCSFSAALTAIRDTVGGIERYRTWQSRFVNNYEFT